MIGGVVAVIVALAWKRDWLHEMVAVATWSASSGAAGAVGHDDAVFFTGLALVASPVLRRYRRPASGRRDPESGPAPVGQMRASGTTTARPSTSPALSASYASTARLSGNSVVFEEMSPRAAKVRTSASSGRVPQ